MDLLADRCVYAVVVIVGLVLVVIASSSPARRSPFRSDVGVAVGVIFSSFFGPDPSPLACIVGFSDK